ncbi:hypothetical protein BBJ28_00003884 [Nothophytophthora sp. Chile5]|nr:hypothetical protein BBJ28_00003884 [Nothophytophthora sp. Chile5]
MADADPVARAREIAARLAAAAIPGGDALGKRKSRWERALCHSLVASVGATEGLIRFARGFCMRFSIVDGGVRPAPGAGDKKRKKVFIPVEKYPDINFMGLLIGPRGSNQKRMEDESGARILIRGKGSSKDPTGDPDEEEELHVLITADSDEAVAKAQSAVEDILFNPQQAMKLKQEQLRKVAELNGTLNENYGGGGGDGDSGRPSGGYGMGGGGGGAPQGHYGPGGGGGGGSGDSRAGSVDMKVPRDLVGYIIGRGGETIRDLQMKSGAHIQIVREEEGAPPSPDRFVNISGSPDTLELAQRLIQNLIDERAQNQSSGGFRERDDRDRMARYGGINPDGSDTVELLVPNERVGLIIGRGGCTIKAIQQRTGSSVTIPQTPDPEHQDMRRITIRGTVEAKEAAKFEIQAMINEEPGQRHGYGMASGQTIYMQVPNERVGVVIGKRGETIKGIQDRHAVRIQIPQVPDPSSNPPVRTISIQGPPQNLTGAKEEIDMVILQGAGTHGYGGGGRPNGQYDGTGGGYDQQQQQYGGGYAAQGQQGQYDAYYQQQQQPQQGQYYQQEATATATAAADQSATATADPNDPNAYWNGYYEYAAYYGVDAANAAWGVTGAAAQASAEAYQQYQQQGVVAASGATPAAAPAASGDASAAATTTTTTTTTTATAEGDATQASSQVC